jgi:glycopeptide antibiotics resistance protein
MLLSFEASHLYLSLAVLGVTLIVLWVIKRSFSYLFFCAIFGIYLIGVVSVVVFPVHIPSGNTEYAFRLQFNLIPLYFGRCDFLFLCLRNIYENILLTIPFGFGVNFVDRVKPRNILWLAIAVGIFLELLQLVLALIVRSPFRAIDINDVLLNAIGALIGYGLFKIFGWIYLYITRKFEIGRKHVFAYIYNVVREQSDY